MISHYEQLKNLSQQDVYPASAYLDDSILVAVWHFYDGDSAQKTTKSIFVDCGIGNRVLDYITLGFYFLSVLYLNHSLNQVKIIHINYERTVSQKMVQVFLAVYLAAGLNFGQPARLASKFVEYVFARARIKTLFYIFYTSCHIMAQYLFAFFLPEECHGPHQTYVTA